MQAIILAGGLGTRLRSVVAEIPKAMAPIKQRPFLEYLLDYWIDQGINEFVLAVGYKYQYIQAYFGDKYKTAKLIYSIENSPLGTGGALLAATDKVRDSNCLVINGDTFFAVNLKKFAAFHLDHQADFSMALFTVAENNRYMGVCMNEQAKIIAANVKPSESQVINGGIYLLQKQLLQEIKKTMHAPLSLEHDLIPYILENKKNLYGFVANEQFIDIGIPEDYFRAEEMLS